MFFTRVAATVASIAALATAQVVNQTTCNSQQYTYKQLAGFGFIPGTNRDKFGDTIGGIGSSIALDRFQWRKLPNGSYSGVIWTLPDRGWNTQGTVNFQPRVHKFGIIFTPNTTATVAKPSGNNVWFTYQNTILFTGPDGKPCTGLDADGSGSITYPGFPPLPVATYQGDGFGGAGPGGRRISIDAEGIVLNLDGSFWISDEYGPYIYHFNPFGTMIGVIRPPEAYIPKRNGSDSFSADSPTFYSGADDDVFPADNPTGRNNNHGFEGLTISADGRSLYALLQAAANQEGGLKKQTERYTRLIEYDITLPFLPRYKAEFIVPLPLYVNPDAKASKNPQVASQSELFSVSDDQFLVLARDSDFGRGQSNPLSNYRHIDVFDISQASDIKSAYFDNQNGSVASDAGVLNSTITPATYCSFLDFNVNSQLNRFGAHNGGAQDAGLLNEKWESIGLVPVDGLVGADGQWFVFSLSDNDFITQDGYQNGGRFEYSDASGFSLDNQALVFQVTLPRGSRVPVGGW